MRLWARFVFSGFHQRVPRACRAWEPQTMGLGFAVLGLALIMQPLNAAAPAAAPAAARPAAPADAQTQALLTTAEAAKAQAALAQAQRCDKAHEKLTEAKSSFLGVCAQLGLGQQTDDCIKKINGCERCNSTGTTTISGQPCDKIRYTGTKAPKPSFESRSSSTESQEDPARTALNNVYADLGRASAGFAPSWLQQNQKRTTSASDKARTEAKEAFEALKRAWQHQACAYLAVDTKTELGKKMEDMRKDVKEARGRADKSRQTASQKEEDLQDKNNAELAKVDAAIEKVTQEAKKEGASLGPKQADLETKIIEANAKIEAGRVQIELLGTQMREEENRILAECQGEANERYKLALQTRAAKRAQSSDSVSGFVAAIEQAGNTEEQRDQKKLDNIRNTCMGRKLNRLRIQSIRERSRAAVQLANQQIRLQGIAIDQLNRQIQSLPGEIQKKLNDLHAELTRLSLKKMQLAGAVTNDAGLAALRTQAAKHEDEASAKEIELTSLGDQLKLAQFVFAGKLGEDGAKAMPVKEYLVKLKTDYEGAKDLHNNCNPQKAAAAATGAAEEAGVDASCLGGKSGELRLSADCGSFDAPTGVK